jgi:predicted MFS family arabinose efflux permease
LGEEQPLQETNSHQAIAQGWSRSSGIVVFGLTLASFFNYVDRNIIAVLIEPIKQELSLSDTQIGLITGLAFALFYAIMGVPIARLADRGNKARILVLCFLLWSVMTALSGAATSFLTLFVLRLMVGVGEAGCIPTSFAIISERFTSAQRPFAISIFQAGGKLGVALGMAGAGLIGELLGWRMALVLVGGLGIPAAIIVALALRGVDQAPEREVATVERASITTILKFPGFVPLITAISLSSFANYGISQWVPAFFVRTYGAGLGEVGVWIGLSSGIGGFAGTLAGGVAAGILIKRHFNWDLWLPALANVLSVPLFVAAFLSPSVVVAAAFYCAATLAVTVGGGVALAAFQRFTAPEHRATANAVMLMISALTGVGLGPVAVGFASDLLNPQLGVESLRWALVLSTAMLVGASVFYALAGRSPAQPVTTA